MSQLSPQADQWAISSGIVGITASESGLVQPWLNMHRLGVSWRRSAAVATSAAFQRGEECPSSWTSTVT